MAALLTCCLALGADLSRRASSLFTQYLHFTAYAAAALAGAWIIGNRIKAFFLFSFFSGPELSFIPGGNKKVSRDFTFFSFVFPDNLIHRLFSCGGKKALAAPPGEELFGAVAHELFSAARKSVRDTLTLVVDFINGGAPSDEEEEEKERKISEQPDALSKDDSQQQKQQQQQQQLQTQQQQQQRQQQLQRDFQDEVERYVQTILDQYVRGWATALTPSQTLDAEVENDLRRGLTEVADSLRDMELRDLLSDAAKALRSHLERVSAALERSDEGRDLVISRFVFLHPALAEAERGDESDAYTLEVAEKVLLRFGLGRVLPSAVAVQCLGQIMCKNVFLNLVHFFSDPEQLQMLVRPFVLGLEEEVPSKVTVPEQHNETKPPSPEDVADFDKKSKGGRNKGSSPSRPSKSLELRKMTIVQPLRLNNVHNGNGGGGSKTSLGGNSLPAAPTRISTALGGLFSATAGPLLPENIAFKPFNKMWRSQSSEDLRRSAALTSPSKRRNNQVRISHFVFLIRKQSIVANTFFADI